MTREDLREHFKEETRGEFERWKIGQFPSLTEINPDYVQWLEDYIIETGDKIEKYKIDEENWVSVIHHQGGWMISDGGQMSKDGKEWEPYDPAKIFESEEN